MKGLRLLLVMVICHSTFSYATQIILRHQSHRTNNSITLNFVLHGKRSHLSKVIAAINGITASQCSVRCFTVPRCQSVNFNVKQNICQLLDDNVHRAIAKERTVKDADWNYYGYDVSLHHDYKN